MRRKKWFANDNDIEDLFPAGLGDFVSNEQSHELNRATNALVIGGAGYIGTHLTLTSRHGTTSYCAVAGEQLLSMRCRKALLMSQEILASAI